MHYRLITSLIIIQFLAILLCFSASAQEPVWVETTGSAPMENVTLETARQNAVKEALRSAVEQVVGAEIASETLVINFQTAGDVIKSLPYGKVLDKEILDEDVKKYTAPGDTKPYLSYWVRVRVKVARENSAADPFFKVDAKLNRYTFQDGDEVEMRIKATKDCYVSVFIILRDDQVIRLVPNRYKTDNFIRAGDTFVYPSRKDKKVGSLIASVPEGKDKVTETIYVLATKQPLNFISEFQDGIYGVYDGKAQFVTELIREIVGLPLSERAEKFVMYEIRKAGTGMD